MSQTVSPEQLAANRANAANSTGPRTPEGKARSAQNARKHGFTASNFAVVRLEDLIATYHPVNSQELFALERVALAQQAILRAARLEADFLTACLNESFDTNGEWENQCCPQPLGNRVVPVLRPPSGRRILQKSAPRCVSQSRPATSTH
jgi:hypothetical protein